MWSISYGWPEVFQCTLVDNVTVANCPTGYDYAMYIKATDTELMKLGMRGISVAVSSGDSGTPGFARNCPIDPTAPLAAFQVGCSGILCCIYGFYKVALTLQYLCFLYAYFEYIF